MLQYVDLKSTGPKSLRGQSVKIEVVAKSVISFKNIVCQIITIDSGILSKDKHYQLDIFMAIMSKNCKKYLTVRDTGPLSH